MANELGAHEPFVPTDEQRKTVRLLKAFHTKEDVINKLIINPETKMTVGKDAFKRVFAEELANAKIEEFKECVCQMKKAMYSENEELAYKASVKNYQLCSKGLLEPKIEINIDDSNPTKIHKIVVGIQSGAISTFEADTMLKAIELESKVAIEEALKEIREIKKSIGLS